MRHCNSGFNKPWSYLVNLYCTTAKYALLNLGAEDRVQDTKADLGPRRNGESFTIEELNRFLKTSVLTSKPTGKRFTGGASSRWADKFERILKKYVSIRKFGRIQPRIINIRLLNMIMDLRVL